MSLHEVTRESVVAVDPGVLWQRVTTPEGVNDELRPWLRMTVPAGWRGRSIAEIEPPERLGRSWILAGGLVPIDFDEIGIAELEPGRFQEDSRMLTMTIWRHERRVEADPAGARVIDRLEFQPRRPLRWIPGYGALYARIVGLIFSHRHRRLAGWAEHSTTRD